MWHSQRLHETTNDNGNNMQCAVQASKLLLHAYMEQQQSKAIFGNAHANEMYTQLCMRLQLLGLHLLRHTESADSIQQN